MRVVYEGDHLEVLEFTGGAFQQNSLLLVAPGANEVIAVDPGAATPELLQTVRARALNLKEVWLTHAHLDHVEGIPGLLQEHDVRVRMHPGGVPLYARVGDQAAAFGLPMSGPLPEPILDLTPGASCQVGAVVFEVREAPGHAPGHVVFWAASESLAVVGDVIFQRSIGRTDLPGGDFQTLMASIRTAVMTLPDETLLLPGHGPETTVAEERMGNPFLLPMTEGGRA
jgi:glyoxylase-like metal-dependent hydrolase (beta-lactamase superfamily II)